MNTDLNEVSAPAVTRGSRVTPRRVYRSLAAAESVTWTLLIAGMLLKYVAHLGALPVLIAGSIHGVVFIAYALMAAVVGVNQNWGAMRTVLAVLTAIVPYATIPFDRALERRGLLDGGWRLRAGDGPRDHKWERRTLRWLLRRPVLLVAVIIVGILAIFSALLLIGPPGGWGAQ